MYFKLVDACIPKASNQLRAHGAVHCAEEWQPTTIGRAESRDFAPRIDYGFVGVGVYGARRAEAHCDSAGLDVSRTHGAHHVVAAAG